MNWTSLIGHFHPLLVHLPIGILLLAWIAALLSRRNSYYFLAPALPFMVRMGAAAAVLSCVSGWLLAGTDDYAAGTLDWHRWLGIGTAAVAVVAAFAPSRLPLLSLSAVLLIATGHLGGSLTHGAGYLLPQNNPEKTGAPVDIQNAIAWEHLIAPVLQSKCFSCHSAKKQKGGLRLDTPEFILAGGKNGHILQPGAASASEMVKRMLLPPDDEHHMPPKERPQLSADEITLLQWWIDAGADFQKKTREIPQTGDIQRLITRMHAQPTTVAGIPDVPTETVAPAPADILEKLRSRGLLVLPVAQNSSYLSVSAVNCTELPDSCWNELGRLAPQLVWLKLDGLQLNDNAWNQLSRLHRLTRLHLAHSNTNDSNITFLKKLPALQVLNLTFTSITAQGAVLLKGQPSLRQLYLYGSKVQPADWSVVMQALPGVRVDSGGYQVPVLVTDTTKLKAENKY